MKIERIRCDRCGIERGPLDDAVHQAVVTVHMVGKHAAIQSKPDLCVGCFDSVVAAVTLAIEELPAIEGPKSDRHH